MAEEPGASGTPSNSQSSTTRNLALHAAANPRYARARHRISSVRPRRAMLVASIALLAVMAIWAGYRVYTLRDAYHEALADVEALEAYSGRDLSTLDRTDLEAIQTRTRHLDQQIARVERATAMPVGAGLIERMYWIGPRYEAGRALIQTARLLTGAGVTASTVGMQTFDAFEATGANAESAPDGPTWLEVVLTHEQELREALDKVAAAKRLRAEIDERYLPEGVRVRMDPLDRALERYDYATLADQYFPLARATLGDDTPVRYLVLFQNPAELRPSGGFPGTMGIVAFERGQLSGYEIFDAHVLSDAYISQNHPPRPQPWAIQEFFPSPSLVLHDATWWADFPRSGRTIFDMYQQTGWPPIDGVVAVQPSVISAFVRIAGNVTITVDGEERLITPENVYNEIERLRILHREGLGPDGRHKEILELIGVELIERFQAADRGMLIEAARALRDAADIRDVQMFMDSSMVQGWLAERRWTGSIGIDASQPTLAITLANVVTNKASMRLVPKVHITLGAEADGRRDVTLELWLTHTGTNEEDPFYAGFSRGWVDIWLPSESVRGSAHPEPMPDPESPDGGSYLLAVFPQETGYLSVSFSMPETNTLRLRRQPGVVPVAFTVADPACDGRTEFVLNSDTVVRLDLLCP